MNNNKKIFIIALAGMLLTVMFTFVQGSWNGRELVGREGCLTCHSLRGSGGSTAPDLTAVSQRRSTFWIMEQIRNPKSHNPDTMMPSFTNLSIIERFSIAQYLRG